MEVLLFGDQTSLSHDFLVKALVQTERSPLISSFRNGAYHILRQEVAYLPHSMRQTIPCFTSISELVENYFSGSSRHPSLDAALTTISQFLHFFK